MIKPLDRRVRPADGAALVTALCVLVAVMAIGLGAAQAALIAEKAARDERDRHIAFQAAEAGLADAERDIEGGADPASERAALFADGSVLGFAEGCGRGPASVNLGLCLYAPAAPAWQAAGLSDPDPDASGAIAYGTFTGATMPSGPGVLPARAPRYIIELMPLARAGEDASGPAANFYRITAIGFGARDSTQVVLQAFYRRAAAGAGVLQ
jgi:Tfp pilus assembly protein PilX